MADGAVSQGTQMKMRGARMMEQGLGMTQGAGQSAQFQANTAQAAAQRGNEAAEIIRQRYYKKEFETVQSVHAEKQYQALRDAQAEYELATKIDMGPVNTLLSPAQATDRNVEMQNRVSATQEMADAGTQVNPEGVANQPNPMPQPSEAPAAVDGGVSIQEVLSYTLPDQRRIDISSPEGFLHQQQAMMKFGAVNTRIHTQMMDLASRYAGNPYMDKWQESIIDNITKHSNMTATGTGDGKDAASKMQEHQMNDARIESMKAETEGQQGLNLARQSATEQGADEFIMRAQSDPEFSGNVRPELLERARNNPDSLTPTMRAKLAAGLGAFKSDEEKEIAAANRSGLITLSATQRANPRNIHEAFANDRLKQQYYTQNTLEISAAEPERLRTSLKEEADRMGDLWAKGATAKKLRALGAEKNDLLAYVKGETTDTMQAVLDTHLATDPGLVDEANDRALAGRLYDVSGRQKETMDMMMASVTEFAEDPSQNKGEGFSPMQKELIYNNYPEWFMRTEYGRSANYTNPYIAQQEKKIRDKYAAEIDGPLARVLGPNPSRADQIAYDLGLPNAPPIQPVPKRTHKDSGSTFIPIGGGGTGSATLIDRAMNVGGFPSDPRGDLDNIAKIAERARVAAANRAARIAQSR